MGMELSGVLRALKLPAKITLALGIIGLGILFLPERMLSGLGLIYFRQTAKPWVSLATWVFLLLPMFELGSAATKHVRKGIHARQTRLRWKESIVAQLTSLSPPERLYLAYCVSRETTSLCLPLNDPPARMLCAKGLLVASAGMGEVQSWPFVVPVEVFKIIVEYRDLLASPNGFRGAEMRFVELEDRMSGRSPGAGYG